MQAAPGAGTIVLEIRIGQPMTARVRSVDLSSFRGYRYRLAFSMVEATARRVRCEESRLVQ